MDGRWSLCWRSDYDLKEFLRLLPALQRAEHDASGVVVYEVVVVSKFRERRVDVDDGYTENRECGAEMTCDHAGLRTIRMDQDMLQAS